MKEEALARLTVAVALGMGIAIFLIMSLAVVGGVASIIKMFLLIGALTQGL